jgi:hypothetical protein
METIEEAALKSYPDDWDRRERLAFIEGANWQTERMYSEKDLEKAIEYGYQLRNNHRPINNGIDWVKEFKETFKNK